MNAFLIKREVEFGFINWFLLYQQERMATSVWEVYYRHWAMEANKIRKKEFSRHSSRKMIKMITEGLWPNERVGTETIIPKIEKEIRLTYMGVRPSLVSRVAQILYPRETPEDKDFLVWGFDELSVEEDRIDRGRHTSGFILSPTEARFWKNMGLDEEESQFQELLSARQAHRLDAILALR